MTAAAITVPAMFELTQAEATQRAAALAKMSRRRSCRNQSPLGLPTATTAT